MDDRQARFDDLLFRALALPPDERQDFLDAACEDADLRGEVLELLGREDELGDFLDRPLFAASSILAGLDAGERTSVEPAADVERHLSHEPAPARPQTLRYRLGKLARRYRVEAVALGIALLILLAGIVGTTYSLLTARQEAAIAEQTLDDGRYIEAESLPLQALATRETQPEETAKLAAALNSTANLYRSQGKLDKALPLRRRVVDLYIELYGEEHLQVAVALENLGVLYAESDQLDKAEERFKRAMAIREKRLQDDHLEIARGLDNLGALYRDLGRLEDAVPMHRRALAIHEKAFGPDHPQVAWSLQHLGDVLIDLGRLQAAGPLIERSLQIREKALGSSHPLIAESLIELGQLTHAEGRLREAEGIFRRALEIRLAKLGEPNAGVGWALSSLAGVLIDGERLDEAEQLLERALESHQEKGESRARDLQLLARIARRRGQDERAESLLKEALELISWGRFRQDLIADYASLLRSVGRETEAEALLVEAAEGDPARSAPATDG